MKTQNVSDLRTLVATHQSKLTQLTDEDMRRTLGEGQWSGKQVLGHLIDSALLNRYRIILGLFEPPENFPGALHFNDAQDNWTRVQAYNDYAWMDLVQLWTTDYLHIVHMVTHAPDDAAHRLCPATFGASSFVMVDWMVGHVFRHMDFHLQEIYHLVGGPVPDGRAVAEAIEKLPRK